MAWWREYYAQSGIALPDKAMQQLWDINNYLLACVSRKGNPPMPLQGVFTADDGRLPPWKGDYHNDLNTQTCYLSYLKANHLQAGESFLDFLTALEPQAKAFSTAFFGAPEGLNLPGVMTLDGLPIGVSTAVRKFASVKLAVTSVAAWAVRARAGIKSNVARARDRRRVRCFFILLSPFISGKIKNLLVEDSNRFC
jgi:hypothetical protein